MSNSLPYLAYCTTSVSLRKRRAGKKTNYFKKDWNINKQLATLDHWENILKPPTFQRLSTLKSALQAGNRVR